MKCPKCGSENVNIQMVTEVKEKAKKGWLYWLFIGWWWEPIAWLFLTLPKLLIAIFGKNQDGQQDAQGSRLSVLRS